MKKRKLSNYEVSDIFFKLEKFSNQNKKKKSIKSKKRDSSTSVDFLRPRNRSNKIIINFEKKKKQKKNNNKNLNSTQNQISSSKMITTPGFELPIKSYKIKVHKKFKDRNHLKFCDLSQISTSSINYNKKKELIIINNKLYITILKFDFKNKYHFFQKYKRISKSGNFFNSVNLFKKKFFNFLIYSKNNGDLFIDDLILKKNFFKKNFDDLKNIFAFEKKFCLVNNNNIDFYDLRDLTKKSFFLKNESANDFIFDIKKKCNTILLSTEKNSFIYDIRNLKTKINLEDFDLKKKMDIEKKNFDFEKKINFRKSIFLNNDEFMSFDFVKNKLNFFNLKKNERKKYNFKEKILDFSFSNFEKKIIFLTEKKNNFNQNLLSYKISPNFFLPENEIILENKFCYKRANYFGEFGKIVLHDKINFEILSQNKI